MRAVRLTSRSVIILVAELGWLLASASLFLTVDASGRVLSWSAFAGQVVFLVVAYVAAFYLAGLCDVAGVCRYRDVLRETAAAAVFVGGAVGTVILCTEWFAVGPVCLACHLVFVVATLPLVRVATAHLLKHLAVRSRLVVAGAGEEARWLAREIMRYDEEGYDICCFAAGEEASGAVLIGTPNPGQRSVPLVALRDLPSFALGCRAGRILVATTDLVPALPFEELGRCRAAGLPVESCESFCERLLGRVSLERAGPEKLVFADGIDRFLAARVAKRAVDLVVAAVVLVAGAPLCLLVALLIKLEDGGPVLFRQTRIGWRGTPFVLRKLRSMKVDAEAETGPVWAQADDPRVTLVGHWIRMLRIDEIPQAWNVLRGEMSFVGPRPERPEFVATLCEAIPYYDQRHTVRPGITGWAQVNFPYAATVDDARRKLEYDLYYLKNFSVLMDLTILVRTAKIILFGWGSR